MTETITPDVIEEFEFYLKSNVPAPAMLAWMETLTPEERQQVQDHATKMYEAIVTIVTDIKEVFEAAWASFMECVTAGLRELENASNDS